MRPRVAPLSVILALALLTAPSSSHGQAAKVYRIGYLGLSASGYPTDPHQCPRPGNPNWKAWVEGLRERGYLPGQNLVIECRYTEGREWQAPGLASELVSLQVDLLVAVGDAQARAARFTTSTIPIVMVKVVDPVGQGLVASLAHPGGNVTGLTDIPMEMERKRLELLNEIVPKISRVAVLHPSGDLEPLLAKGREAAARALGVTLLYYPVTGSKSLTDAFTAMTKARAQALFVVPDPFWGGLELRIVEEAAQSRLPAMYQDKNFVDAGGLLSYEVNEPDGFRRLGGYVDKIFHGAKPGDLPTEQPTKFDMRINLQAAKAIGLTLPPSLLRRAGKVIQ